MYVSRRRFILFAVLIGLWVKCRRLLAAKTAAIDGTKLGLVACGLASALRRTRWISSLIRCASKCFDCLRWRRRRDWFCCAKSLRYHLRRPISASLRRTSFSSLSAIADVLIWLCQMAEQEGLVLLRKISSRPPMVSHLRFAPSNPVVRISSFLPPFCGFALNGGEGGIGFAAQNLFKTTYGVPSALRSVEPDGSHLILLTTLLRLRLKWRRRRDSNPRCHF